MTNIEKLLNKNECKAIESCKCKDVKGFYIAYSIYFELERGNLFKVAHNGT